MKFSLMFLPNTVFAYVCFVFSQREVQGTLETFSVFNILTAVSMVYIVFTSNEDRYTMFIMQSFKESQLILKVVWCLPEEIYK